MNKRRMTRRDFVKGFAGFIGLLSLSGCAGVPLPLPGIEETEASERAVDGFDTVANSSDRFAMVMDVGACIGCRRCVWACKEENNISDTISPFWIEVLEMKSQEGETGRPSLQDLEERGDPWYTESPREGRWYLPMHCMHCDDPPCVKVCPTGATYRDVDGLVLMDYNKCVGCRFCMIACPYSVRRFNWGKPKVPDEQVNELVPLRPIGVVEKCTFCVHRVRKGLLPRCVEVCPVQAKHFGNLKDPESEVSRLLRAESSFRLLEELGTHPHMFYITRGRKWLE